MEDQSYRAVNIKWEIAEGAKKSVKSILLLIWGADIFINDIPVLKSLVLANVIVWVIMLVYLKSC